jgi:hypothetical protein
VDTPAIVKDWRRARLHSSDDASANDRLGRYYELNLGLGGRVPCQLHKAMAISTKCAVLVESSIGGLLNAMMVLNQVRARMFSGSKLARH